MYIRGGWKGDLRNIICRNVKYFCYTTLENEIALSKKRKLERRYRLFIIGIDSRDQFLSSAYVAS